MRVPVATGEVRIRGIDPSTTAEEIANELTVVGGCPREELKISPVVTMRDGMGAVWANCPLETAVRLAEIGTVTLGWTRIRVVLLRKRPIQCYRRFEHVRTSCRSEVDRTGACFRCGLAGHAATSCGAGFPSCVICKELDKDHRHRIGSSRCLENQGFPSGIQPVKRLAQSRIPRYDADK